MGHEAWSDDAPPAPEPDPYRPGEANLHGTPPVQPAGEYPYPGVDPASMVKAPAICMIIFGVLFSLSSLCGVAQGVLLIAGIMPQQEIPEDMPPEMADFMQTMNDVTPITNIAFGTMGLVSSILCFVGGMRLLSMRGGTLVRVAAVLIMVPLWGCCCLGIPLGIWVLVTLGKPEVAAALTD